MKRFLIPAVMAAFAATPTFADQISLGDLSAYLNDIRTAQGDFTQINGDGSISTGTISMHRPGRIRFDYDGDDVLVMAGGGQVAIFDGRSNSRPEQYPLSRTPLNLILDRNVDLARSGMVVAQEYDGTATRVTAQDPDQPQIGTITLVFTDDPVELRQWVIVDEGGSETTVVLGALQQDVRVASRLFSIPQEISARGVD
jgi:outer membrane lipoprotein-sorting protein